MNHRIRQAHTRKTHTRKARRLSFFLLRLFAVFLAATTADAQSNARAGGPPVDDPRFIARWDADGDGVVSESELQAARTQRDETRQQNLSLYDADGDGRLSRAERETAREAGAELGPRRGKRGGDGERVRSGSSRGPRNAVREERDR